MRKQLLVAVAVAALALGTFGGLAWAAGSVSVNIPFSFMVKDKEMPAGTYEIRSQGSDEGELVIKGVKSGASATVQVIERLADTGAKQPKIVFDKMEDGKSFLSEVHIPGADGFLVGIAKGKEKHVTVNGNQ
jgi:hypothetical protein